MKRDRIKQGLNELFPNAGCELKHNSNFELLVAVILSAQCTDKRVNEVTEKLFKVASTPQQFASMPLQELEKWIYSCGFYHNKAKNIIAASSDICEKYNGEIPRSYKDLVGLAGVGNKTANVVTSVAFGGDAFAVDTHVLRVANRLELVDTKNPDVCMKQLKQYFDKKDWTRLHYQMVLFGRYKCKSRGPMCEECPFQDMCKYYRERGK